MFEPKPFRAAVGEVAQAAAELEVSVGIVTWGLAGLEQPIARSVVPNSMSRMLEIIRDLAPERIEDESLREEVLCWTRNVQVAYAKRGAVIHSVWLGDGGQGPHRAGDVRPMRRDPIVRTASDLLALAVDLQRLATTEAAFIERLALAVGGKHWSVDYSDSPEG